MFKNIKNLSKRVKKNITYKNIKSITYKIVHMILMSIYDISIKYFLNKCLSIIIDLLL
jgi:hypothetical protein